jgi:hypothetical protein
MLGVFSSNPPGSAQGPAVQRYYIHENGELDYLSGPTSDLERRTWRRDGDETILMYPGPSEEGVFPQELYNWRILWKDRCVLEKREIFNGVESDGGADLYRGEVCVRSIESDLHGGEYEYYWCDEPPPEPCGDEEE